VWRLKPRWKGSADDGIPNAAHDGGMIPFGWLGVVGLLLLALAFPRTADAQPYGAIAYDEKTGSWGVSYNETSQGLANARALGECRKHAKGCDVVVRFWGGLCAAYATGAGPAAGRGTGDSHGVAERNAVAACSVQGKRCEPRVWSSNDRGTAGNEAFAPTKKCSYWDSASRQYVTRFCSSTR
jgi:hypothetical protein